LERPGSYERLRKIGKRIMRGISDGAVDSSVEVLVQGPGPFWGTCFTDREEVTNVRQIMEIPFHPHIRRSAVFFQELVKHGVFAIPARNGRTYVYTAHSQEGADKTKAFEEARKIG
jgi:glutamate-1-semialdehyde aminotransferase